MRYAVFAASAALTAVLVVFVWVSLLSQYPWRALPRASSGQLQSVPTDTRALVSHSFAGFVRSGRQEHWVRVSGVTAERWGSAPVTLSSPQPVRLELTLADGLGTRSFAGWVDPATGALHLYVEHASSRFTDFRRVEGRVAGPALVNGVPTLYLEACPVSTAEAADGDRDRWVGHLVVQESP